MMIFFQHIFDQIDIGLMIKFGCGCFLAVIIYSLMAFFLVYLLTRNSDDKPASSLLIKFFLKTPLTLTGYGYLFGAVGYFALLIVDFHGDSAQTDRSGNEVIVLVVFTLLGMFYGMLVGLAFFLNSYTTLFKKDKK